MEPSGKLLDQMKRNLKTFGMVQNVVLVGQYLRSPGVRPYLEVHLLFPLLPISPVMILKIMKKWPVPECRPPGSVFTTLIMTVQPKDIRLLESALHTCCTRVSYIKLQLLLEMRTSWHIKSRELSWTVLSVCLHFSFGLTGLSRQLMHIWRRLFLVSAEI